MSYEIYCTDIGKLAIVENRGAITNIYFENSIEENIKLFYMEKIETKLSKRCIFEIREYLDGKLKKFSIPIAPDLTLFQKRVFEEVLKIEYGKTASYIEIAERVGNKNSARAVGNANNKNPIPIIIPCHRIIGKNMALKGYSGGLDIKKQLLKIEKENL